MFAAAEELRFEYAAKLRDEIKDLRRELMALAARQPPEEGAMCRNIRTLHNFEPPATEDEVHAAGAPVRPQDQRHDEAVEGERGGLRARRRRRDGSDAAACSRSS